jgi:hypothetical protein
VAVVRNARRLMSTSMPASREGPSMAPHTPCRAAGAPLLAPGLADQLGHRRGRMTALS